MSQSNPSQMESKKPPFRVLFHPLLVHLYFLLSEILEVCIVIYPVDLIITRCLGFRHDSLSTAPSTSFVNPSWATASDIDFAGNKPTNIVRIGTGDR